VAEPGKTNSFDLSEISAPRAVEIADSIISPPSKRRRDHTATRREGPLNPRLAMLAETAVADPEALVPRLRWPKKRGVIAPIGSFSKSVRNAIHVLRLFSIDGAPFQ